MVMLRAGERKQRKGIGYGKGVPLEKVVREDLTEMVTLE